MTAPPVTGDGAAVLERLDAAMRDLEPLPVMGRALKRVQALTEDPESSTHELVRAIETDVNLTANLLRYANSAHAARPIRAATVHQAVTLLGRATVATRALEAEVCSYFERAPGTGGVALGQLQIHATHVAALAGELARRAGCDVASAHLAGLLHDVGKVVLPRVFDIEATDRAALGSAGGPARVAAEQATLGIDHAAAGARFAALSLLPPDVVDAIAGHHGAQGELEAGPVTRCVQVANACIAALSGLPFDDRLMDDGMRALGIDAAEIEEIAYGALPTLAATADQRPALSEYVARLEQEARTDDLTGLLNRRYWTSAAQEWLAGGDAALLMLDVDHFKAINDLHGHQTGDVVLSSVAGLLPARGLAGRLGGDEFALLTSEPAEAVAAAILDQLRRWGEQTGMAVSVSIGAVRAPAGDADMTGLLRLADEQLYAAKRAGRGTFSVAGTAAAAA